MDILLTLILILVFLLMEGFFSGSEIGVVSADQMKLRHEAAKGSRGAKLALEMLKKPEWLLSTTLVGTNIAVVSNTTIVTALMIELFGEQHSWFAIILVAPLIWIFGEIVPKSIFQQRAHTHCIHADDAPAHMGFRAKDPKSLHPSRRDSDHAADAGCRRRYPARGKGHDPAHFQLFRDNRL
jgi:hypothetical protein